MFLPVKRAWNAVIHPYFSSIFGCTEITELIKLHQRGWALECYRKIIVRKYVDDLMLNAFL